MSYNAIMILKNITVFKKLIMNSSEHAILVLYLEYTVKEFC